jgi:hypothetical protein
MPILTKDAILSADDLKRETVPVPEWGGEVIVQEMTAKARMDWGNSAYKTDELGGLVADKEKFAASMLVASCVGEDNEPLFSLEDIAALSRKSGKAVDRVLAVALRLNGMSGEAKEKIKKN